MAHYSKKAVSFSRLTPLIPYSSIVFLICLGDAIMSYTSPVYIESHVRNTAVMGLIISTSSAFGFLCDILFVKIFARRSARFFLWLTILTAALFPAIFLLFPPGLPTFIFGMIVWGIYFELLLFSNFNFINEYIPQTHYSGAWGTIGSFKSSAYLLGPVVAGFLLSLSIRINFTGPLVAYLLALLGLFVFYSSFSGHKNTPPVPSPEPSAWLSLSQELAIWSRLMKKIWPVYIFLFCLSLVDATFWTLGTLISEHLRALFAWGSLFLPAYSLPGLIVGLIVNKIFPPTGKKRVAFATSFVGSLILSLIGVVNIPWALILIVFVASAFLSFSFPEIYAVFEDYIHRLGHSGSNMVGLERSAVSLSFIFGPILAGVLAAVSSERTAFCIISLLLALISAICMVIVPRKILLPQSEISQISA